MGKRIVPEELINSTYTNENGDVKRVISGEIYIVNKQNYKADNKLLKFLDVNGYRCIRSNKKLIQEYKFW